MSKALRLIESQGHHCLHLRRQANLSSNLALPTGHDGFHLLTDLIRFNPHPPQDGMSNIFASLQQAQEDMLGANVILLKALRLFLSTLQHPFRLVAKPYFCALDPTDNTRGDIHFRPEDVFPDHIDRTDMNPGAHPARREPEL